jgi:DNA-binding transcriptional MerR regulator
MEVSVMTVGQLLAREETIRIGDLAAKTGISVEALRYYEQRGLVTPSGRRASGYREYPADAVRLVRFIKRAQGLGFSLAEVEELVRLRQGAWSGDAPWQLREAAIAKVQDIDRRMAELGALKGALSSLIEACDDACPVESMKAGDPLPCPLIEAFDTPDASDLADARDSKQRKRQ